MRMKLANISARLLRHRYQCMGITSSLFIGCDMAKISRNFNIWRTFPEISGNISDNFGIIMVPGSRHAKHA